jgi:hypothetical protein
MGKLVVVGGVERHAILKPPNVIQCDLCFVEMPTNSRKYSTPREVNSHRFAAAKDHGWYSEGDKDYCPACTDV